MLAYKRLLKSNIIAHAKLLVTNKIIISLTKYYFNYSTYRNEYDDFKEMNL